MNDFRFRQIHLDFHTSEKVPGIGLKFDPEKFAATLKKAHVDSITCFARCHHGMMYYDSQRYPELIHPEMKQKDLLKEQIDACHKAGIKAPIYTTVQWDGLFSTLHPEYCIITPEGKIQEFKPHEAGFYGFLCVNSPYREFLKEHVAELLLNYDVDGFFFDIVTLQDCSCANCMKGMRELEMDYSKKEVRLAYAQKMLDEFKEEMTEHVRSYNSECSIFYNGGHFDPTIRESQETFSHFEIESLPSGGWGYAHYPLVARYVRGLGEDFLGMTGKFHTHWGDFHSLKNQAALEYECFNIISLNGGCSIGDQLHPYGELDESAYDLIGKVYSSVEEKEPWCRGTSSLADIGVFNVEEWIKKNLPDPMIGAVRMLESISAQFDIIDTKSDFSKYKLLIMPDKVPVDHVLEKKLSEYLANGGKIIATYESGLNPETNNFELQEFGFNNITTELIDDFGEDAVGKYYFNNNFSDFIKPKSFLGKGLANTEYSMYIQGLTIETDDSTEILEHKIVPFFYRTHKAFSSHQQTPSSEVEGTPLAVKKDNVIYFTDPLFTIYKKKGPKWITTILKNAIENLIEPQVVHSGPSSLHTRLNEQGDSKWILHLLHYIPEKKCDQIELIEDVIPVYNIDMSVLCGKEPKQVSLVPDRLDLGFTYEDGRINFNLSELNGHQIIEIKF